MKNRYLFILFLLFAFGSLTFGQDDYQIVQNYKTQYLQIEHAIKSADSLAQLYVLQEAINKLKTDYQPHKNLLDKSLYPDDFSASLTNLRNALQLRERDFTQISKLKSQVVELKIQIDSLNNKNTVLLNKIQLLQLQSRKDKKIVEALRQNISSLLVSLHKRDGLIMNMLDSLMPPNIREQTELNKNEKQKIYSEAEKQNVLTNIRKAINDNMKFLELTYLNPEDITKIKKQENQFENLWKAMSSKMIEIYSERGENAKDVSEINAGFNNWRKALYLEAWSTIRQDFRSHGINLNNFTSGGEFTSRVTAFINDEIKNAKLQGDESRKMYKMFADSAWFGDFKPKWMVYLTENKMLAESQKDSIENKIAEWKDAAFPASYTWIYILVGAFIIFVVIPLIIKRKKLNKGREPKVDEKKDSMQV